MDRQASHRMRSRPALRIARPYNPGLVALVALLGLAWRAPAAVAGVPDEAPLDVVVTTKPLHALVAQVMNGVGVPQLLVTGAASPHAFALSPSGARALQSARILFRISAAIEPFTRRLVETLPASVRVVTLSEAEGVTLLDQRTNGAFESHDHVDEAERGEPHAQAGTRSVLKDGHIWLDPENAKAMVTAIAGTLSAAAPAHAGTFRENAAAARARLDALRQEIGEALAPVREKPFIVFHDAYQYFEHRFALNAVGAITVSPEVQPSARRLSEIRARLSQTGAECVFAEPNFSPRLVAAVIEGTRARSGILDPEGARLEPGPDAYDTLLRNLAAGLKACLE